MTKARVHHKPVLYGIVTKFKCIALF